MTTVLSDRAAAGSPRVRSWRWVLGAGALYLALAVATWWNIWSADPTTTTVCGCGDAARFLWFFEWPSFSLTHGHSLLWSSFLNHPNGINLLNDTSVLGLSIPAIPLTLLGGPVLSMNLALTLAPAGSALAMYALARRFTSWQPAAVLVGLAYGFSTFVIDPAASGQLNLAFLVTPPLIVLLLDEIIRRRRIAARIAGVLLGLLIVLQFFLSPELLLLMAFGSLAAVVPLAVVLRAERRGEAPGASRHIATAGISAGIFSFVLLAYPIWYYFAGPSHLSGSIWGSEARIWQWGTTPKSLIWQTGSPYGSAIQHLFGSHTGADLPSYSYLGLGFVVVAFLGLLRRRDRVLQFFFATGLVSALLSLSPVETAWAPWSLLRHMALLDSVAEYRFTFITLLCLMLVVARSLDGFAVWLSAHSPKVAPALRGTILSVVLVAVALPNLLVLRPILPLSANPIGTPTWFRTIGAHLPKGEVLLVYPPPFSGLQASQAWQADTGMRWAQVGVGGPAGTLTRATVNKAGIGLILSEASPLAPPIADLRASGVRQVRLALIMWGVTRIVVPEQEGLGFGAAGRSTTSAVAFFTAVMSSVPKYQAGAWVWPVRHRLPPVSSDLLKRYEGCTVPSKASPKTVLSCMSAGLLGV